MCIVPSKAANGVTVGVAVGIGVGSLVGVMEIGSEVAIGTGVFWIKVTVAIEDATTVAVISLVFIGVGTVLVGLGNSGVGAELSTCISDVSKLICVGSAAAVGSLETT